MCNPWSHRDAFAFICFIAVGHSISLGLCPTKLPVKWDIQIGQLDVPENFPSFLHGMRLCQEPHSADKYDRRHSDRFVVDLETLGLFSF